MTTQTHEKIDVLIGATDRRICSTCDGEFTGTEFTLVVDDQPMCRECATRHFPAGSLIELAGDVVASLNDLDATIHANLRGADVVEAANLCNLIIAGAERIASSWRGIAKSLVADPVTIELDDDQCAQVDLLDDQRLILAVPNGRDLSPDQARRIARSLLETADVAEES